VAAAAEAKRRGIPLVATQHFLPEYLLEYLPKVAPLQRLVQAGLGRRLSRLYAGCACLTVPTETVRRAVGRLSVPVKVISNGVDTRRFSPAKQLPDTPTLLYLGRLDPEKNLPVLLEACAGLDVPCQLRIIGWGNLEPELRRYAESLGGGGGMAACAIP